MKKATISSQNQTINDWFDNAVSTLRVHEIQLETGTSSTEIENIYKAAIEGDLLELARINKHHYQKVVISKILIEYLQLIKESNFEKIAFAISDSKLLVWLVIEDDDIKSELSFINADAEINGKFQEYGYCMDTMIIEKSDPIQIPSHYNEIQ